MSQNIVFDSLNEGQRLEVVKTKAEQLIQMAKDSNDENLVLKKEIYALKRLLVESEEAKQLRQVTEEENITLRQYIVAHLGADALEDAL